MTELKNSYVLKTSASCIGTVNRIKNVCSFPAFSFLEQSQHIETDIKQNEATNRVNVLSDSDSYLQTTSFFNKGEEYL